MGFHHQWVEDALLRSATAADESRQPDLPIAEKDDVAPSSEEAEMTVWEWAYAIFRAPVPLIDYDKQLKERGRGHKA